MKNLSWLISAILGAVVALLLVFLLWGHIFMPKFGIIDIAKVVDESERAQELNRQLTARYNELVAEIQAAQPPEQSDDTDGSEIERKAYAEYLRFRQELETQFQQEIDNAVSKVAEQRRLMFVIDADVVRFGGVDISDDVAKLLQ